MFLNLEFPRKFSTESSWQKSSYKRQIPVWKLLKSKFFNFIRDGSKISWISLEHAFFNCRISLTAKYLITATYVQTYIYVLQVSNYLASDRPGARISIQNVFTEHNQYLHGSDLPRCGWGNSKSVNLISVLHVIALFVFTTNPLERI